MVARRPHFDRERLKIDALNRVETSDFLPIAIWIVVPSPVVMLHHLNIVVRHHPSTGTMMIRSILVVRE